MSSPVVSSAQDSTGSTSNQRLARFAAELRLDQVPEEVVRHAKTCLLDTLGCGLFGSTLDWTQIAHRTIRDIDTATAASAWGTADSFSPPHAALLNGSAVHAFELDDLHAASIVHPGSVVVPAALAVAAGRQRSGADILTAIIAGYETAARVGLTMGAAHLLAGWHPTGTHGALGAAAAAGSVLGLDVEQMSNAFGCAGSMAAGLMAAQYESMVKRLHAGRAAQSGVYSALLAANGYVGIADLFEADYGGYCATFSPTFDVGPLTDALGRTWHTAAVGFKPYSCNGSCQPSIEILRQLRADGVCADTVRSVDIEVSTATVKHVGWPYQPGTITTAQMNLPYIAAVVLTDGDAFVDQFTAARVADPALVELAGRVRVHAAADIDALGDRARHMTRLSVTCQDGTTRTGQRDYARGSARDPLSAHDVNEKFQRLAAKAVPDSQAQQLADLVSRLDEVKDAGELVDLLALPTERRAAQ